MNSRPMSTISKERVKDILEFGAGRIISPITDDEIMELARIALASLEAEPAIHRWRRVTVEPYGPYPWHYGNFIGFSKPVEGIEDEYFYSAPSTPVSVPDLKELEAILDWILMLPCPTPKATQMAKRLAVVIDTCRAAMLQGAEQTNHRAIVERIAEIVHGKVTDIDLLTVTVKSMKDKLHK